MKKKKLLTMLGAAVLILSLLAVPCITGCAKPAEEEPIKLGALLSFTGPMAFSGPLVIDGITLRLEQANYQVAGRPIELVVGDAATDTSVALEKAKKMVEMDKVCFIIGPMISGIRMGLHPYLAEQKTLTISIHSDPLEATEYGTALLFPSTLLMASLPVAQYASEELGYRTATCVGADYVAGHTYIEAVAEQFEKLGGRAIQKQWAPLGTMDWGPYLVNLKKADCVAVWTIDSDIVPFMQQYREFGLDMPIIMPEAMTITSAMIAEKGELFKGIVAGNIFYYWGLDNPANKEFVAAFEAKYGRKPEHHEGNAYIATSIFLAGLEKTGGDTSFERLREAILGLEMETPGGPLSFLPNGLALTNIYICDVRVVDGEWVWYTIKTYVQPRDPRL